MKKVTEGQCKGTGKLLLPLTNLFHFPFLYVNFSNAHNLPSALMLNPWPAQRCRTHSPVSTPQPPQHWQSDTAHLTISLQPTTAIG